MVRHVVVTVCVALLTGCGLTQPPSGALTSTPSSGVGAAVTRDAEHPTVEPSGFTEWEKAALRVRNVKCLGVASGSGFAIAPRFFVTNRHVVEDSLDIQISGFDGRELGVTAIGATLIADLAVVETHDDLPFTLNLGTEDPPVGTHITVVGYPRGEELTTSDGHVVAYSDDPLHDSSEQMMENDAPIEPGSSGSPVIADDGKVVGVAYAGTMIRDRFFAVPVSVLRTILNSPDHTRYEPACGGRLTDVSNYKQCSDSVSAGAVTSCPFALAVERAWVASGRLDGVVMATSPITNKTYQMRCQAGTRLATCYGGDGAEVIIGLR